MTQEPAKSFEAVATWLGSVEWFIYVATGVVLLFYQFPAYKRFRTRALLLLVLSGALAVFILIFDMTFAQYDSSDPNPNALWGFLLLREIMWLTSVIVGTVGALMFLRDYTRLASAAGSTRS